MFSIGSFILIGQIKLMPVISSACFFGSLQKQERVQWRNCQSLYEAQQDVLHYILMWYNADRLHSYLRHKSPAQYESEIMMLMKKVA
ncbi:MAG: hypothetical protein CSA49_03730 [Gammaproteobacteria bacterium]|nr:MAG: hypothetical protein CSA49_03730 [Gammaproteobacteria bacterium]